MENINLQWISRDFAIASKQKCETTPIEYQKGFKFDFDFDKDLKIMVNFPFDLVRNWGAIELKITDIKCEITPLKYSDYKLSCSFENVNFQGGKYANLFQYGLF